MSKVDLDKLLELEAKATSGPWVADLKECVIADPEDEFPIAACRLPNGENSKLHTQFITSIRNSIRELCLELKASMKVVEAARALHIEFPKEYVRSCDVFSVYGEKRQALLDALNELDAKK